MGLTRHQLLSYLACATCPSCLLKSDVNNLPCTCPAYIRRQHEVNAGRALGSAIYVERGGCISGVESTTSPLIVGSAGAREPADPKRYTVVFKHNYGVCGGALHVEQVSATAIACVVRMYLVTDSPDIQSRMSMSIDQM